VQSKHVVLSNSFYAAYILPVLTPIAHWIARAIAESQLRSTLIGGLKMTQLLTRFWNNDEGQDIAEYALMLAVILVIVIATVSLIGTNANTIFSKVASSLNK
jgi:pilus assembly protein Flp/PilA